MQSTSPQALQTEDYGPSRYDDASATRQLVERTLQELFPGARTDVRYLLGSGVGMVSGAALAHFHLHRDDTVVQAMIKMAPSVGDRERQGGRLISPHLRIPAELEPCGPDHYLYHRVHGTTVDECVRGKHVAGRENYLVMVRQHLAMWRETLSRDYQPTGYIGKLDGTISDIGQYTLGQQSLAELADRRLVINKIELPSIATALSEMTGILRSSQTTVLSHGDEGSCNTVICRDDGRTPFFLDHGTAGRRVVGEPIAKTLGWFPATLTQKQTCMVDTTHDGIIAIDYDIHLDPDVQLMITEARDLILSELGSAVDRRELAACMAMYFLRELQWLSRRGRELMLVPLFAMAMEAAGTTYGITSLPFLD